MPVTVAVDAAERIRYTTMSGDVCETDLIAAFMRAMDDPRIDPTLDQIVDMRGVQRLDVSAAGVWRLAQVVSAADPPDVARRVAIVASSDYLFGMARMYEALRATAAAPEVYQVFRDMAAAREWLGLGPEKAAMTEGEASP
jgi:hypothetical protein